MVDKVSNIDKSDIVIDASVYNERSEVRSVDLVGRVLEGKDFLVDDVVDFSEGSLMRNADFNVEQVDVVSFMNAFLESLDELLGFGKFFIDFFLVSFFNSFGLIFSHISLSQSFISSIKPEDVIRSSNRLEENSQLFLFKRPAIEQDVVRTISGSNFFLEILDEFRERNFFDLIIFSTESHLEQLIDSVVIYDLGNISVFQVSSNGRFSSKFGANEEAVSASILDVAIELIQMVIVNSDKSAVSVIFGVQVSALESKRLVGEGNQMSDFAAILFEEFKGSKSVGEATKDEFSLGKVIEEDSLDQSDLIFIKVMTRLQGS